MSLQILEKHRDIWQSKKILQDIYLYWYKQIRAQCVVSGPSLEIGGGGGNLKESFPNLISSDYTLCPWLDLNLDAHALPFRSETLSNIIVIDVLHHLNRPLAFLEEAQRVLKKNGRLIMLEPCVTLGSSFVYRLLHQEDVDFGVDVFQEDGWEQGDAKNPFDGNMAIPTALFLRNSEQLAARFPDFPVILKNYSDYFVYPLSGGFDHVALIPRSCLPFCREIERLLHPLGSLLAYRMLVVMENSCG